MEKIRIGKSIEISVNQNGDTIRINAEDQNFLEKFYRLLEKMEETEAKLKADGESKLSEHEKLKSVIKETQGIMEEIDGAFGEGSCKKIFGDIVPGMYLLADFFYQLKPIVARYSAERNREIKTRYNINRKGAGSAK